MRHPLHWRSRWLRAILAIALVIVALRLGWGWYARAELSKQIQAIRARGEPVWPTDIKFEAVPDAENAFSLQMRAARSTVSGVDSPRSSNLTYAGYPPYGRLWMSLAAGSETAHGTVFALMRQARSLSRVQIRSGLSSPLFSTVPPQLNSMRHLANITCDGVLYKHVTGDDAEAVARAIDVLHLTRSLRQDGFMVSQLVATGIDASACDSIAIMAPAINAPEGSPARQRVRELIARLLDERDIRDGLRRSMEFERVMQVDESRREAAGTWWLAPLAGMGELQTHRFIDAALEAARVGNRPGTQAALAKAGTDDERQGLSVPRRPSTRPGTIAAVPRYSRWFGPDVVAPDRYFEVHFRLIAERRSAAVSLAVRLYRIDHGTWPAKLEDLVPTYVPAVPADPFCDDGRPLGYMIARRVLPDGGDRALLYFEAGPQDPGGWVPYPTYSWEQSRRLPGGIRQYRDLSRWSPEPGTPAGVFTPSALNSATTRPG
jgi:hypothetical protein